MKITAICSPLLLVSLSVQLLCLSVYFIVPKETNTENRPYSYSQYWTGTSLEWRLMRANIIKKR